MFVKVNNQKKEMSIISKKVKIISIITFSVIIVGLLIGIILTPPLEKEGIGEIMGDAVLHERGKISLFGLIEINPGLLSAFIVTGVILVFSLIVRIFFIPRFKLVPTKFQLVIETAVGAFDNMSKTNSPTRNSFLGAYIFAAGVFIFISTLFELFGFQAVAASGNPVTLPAPLSDINGAIALGCLSYLIILSGGIAQNKFRGVLYTLKEFSLPISMSFRLFGALLSGALVSELVYYFAAVSYVVPVFVGFMFTILHALIQAYVLTLLTAMYYGEVSHPHVKKAKKQKTK